MIYVCYGMQKSASTFAFQLAIDVARQRSDQQAIRERLPDDMRQEFVSEQLGRHLTRCSELVPADETYILKTHCPLNRNTEQLISDGKVKGIVSYRNPFDIVVSLKDAGERERQKEIGEQREYFTKIESHTDALKLIDPIMDVARTWLDFDRAKLLRIHFPDIARTPEKIVRQIAEFTGIETDCESIVEAYRSKQKKIFEFNVGRENRGATELTVEDDSPVKINMDQFVHAYCKAA